MVNRSNLGHVLTDTIDLAERFIVTDVEGRLRYISGGQLHRAVRGIRKVAWPRDGETCEQYLAGLVDVGLDPAALILASYFVPGKELGELHFAILDKGNSPSI